jgi:hypothetical protein
MMRRFLTVFVTLLCLFGGTNIRTAGDRMAVSKDSFTQKEMPDTLTPMFALDLVKERYATNFEKIAIAETKEYYYKLSEADYYLVYEGYYPEKNYYLVHLYEFVTDDPATGTGHAVTYGWFLVDKDTGAMQVQT